MKEKAKCKLSSELKNTTCYSLHEPKQETKELYVKVMKKRITSIVSLRCKLIIAFRSRRKALAEKVRASKLTNAVLNIAVRKLLNKVLKRRKQIVGEFLTCVHLLMFSQYLVIISENVGTQLHLRLTSTTRVTLWSSMTFPFLLTAMGGV